MRIRTLQNDEMTRGFSTTAEHFVTICGDIRLNLYGARHTD